MNSMKKINAYMQLLLLSVVLLSISCTGDFENMNRNPNEVTDGQMDALNYKIGTKFQSLQGLVVPVQEHMYQFNESLSGGPFGGYIGATVDSWLTKFETFNPSADWRKWPFANVITETYTPWRGIVTGTDDEVAVAFAKLLRVAIMHRVTDSYGPIPYSNLETNESITVKYDKQEEVYMKMFGELDEAIAAFAANTTLPAEAFSRYDRVYGGNIAQWLKYANSLKLRMAMRLSEVKPDVARTKAAEAIAAGVITANADNAAMHAAENRTTLMLPSGGKAATREHSLKESMAELWLVFKEFFTKKYIVWYICFIILYRFAEGFVIKIVPLFLKAPIADQGLGLTEQEIGLYYGTFGAAAFVLGSLLGGYYISAKGLRKVLFTLCCCFNIPFLVYTFLACFQPDNGLIIASAIVFEYFGYGFGFVGLMLFMMQQVAPGKHQMAHYAFASGIMNLGVMLPGMMSGFVSDWLGYKYFFIVTLLAMIPSFLVAYFVPFTYDDKGNKLVQ